MGILSPMTLAHRGVVCRSLPRMGHNLEDHFDFAEFMTKMHSPLGEYVVWAVIFSTVLVAFGPLLHSNYYFTGRFLPKDQGNTQLCDDSSNLQLDNSKIVLNWMSIPRLRRRQKK